MKRFLGFGGDEPQTPTSQEGTINGGTSKAIATVILALAGVAGINLSPEHAAIIGTVMSILLPFTPSIFSRRKQ